MKSNLSKLAVATLIVASVSAFAQSPALDVDPSRHGNLAAAQELLNQAYDRIGDAQSANRGHLGGHAARAKDLLRQAAEEVRLAAFTADQR